MYANRADETLPQANKNEKITRCFNKDVCTVVRSSAKINGGGNFDVVQNLKRKILRKGNYGAILTT